MSGIVLSLSMQRVVLPKSPKPAVIVGVHHETAGAEGFALLRNQAVDRAKAPLDQSNFRVYAVA